MNLISLQAAVALTDRSERTLWRMIADGSVTRTVENGKALIDLHSLAPSLCVPLEADDYALVIKADQGDASAQTDLALIFFSHGKTKGAIYWLEQASKQGFPEAMNWLGHCHVAGNGVGKDEATGLAWLGKAAALGHVISKAQISGVVYGRN